MDDKKFIFISIARFGFSCHYPTKFYDNGSSKSKLQGYDEPDFTRAEDGCLVVDTRPAFNRPDFVRNVLAAPLVDVDLKDDEVEECPEPSEMLVAGVAGNTFGTLLALHKAQKGSEKKYGSLDSISPSAYSVWWHERGARVGTVQNGEVQWYDDSQSQS